MRSSRGLVSTLAIILLVLAIAATVDAGSVFIANISGFDADLVNRTRPTLVAWIQMSGHTCTQSRANADYLMRFSVVSADTNRPFNWRFLLFPLWPIIPVVPVEAEVMLSMTITTPDGRDVYSNIAGGEAGQWIFGDFYSRKWAKRKAFEQAFQRVVVSAYLP